MCGPNNETPIGYDGKCYCTECMLLRESLLTGGRKAEKETAREKHLSDIEMINQNGRTK